MSTLPAGVITLKMMEDFVRDPKNVDQFPMTCLGDRLHCATARFRMPKGRRRRTKDVPEDCSIVRGTLTAYFDDEALLEEMRVGAEAMARYIRQRLDELMLGALMYGERTP